MGLEDGGTRAAPRGRTVDDRVADEAMARYAAGEDTAFTLVYDHVAPLLERYLARRVRDRELIRDLMQKTFFKMHLHRARFIAGAAVRPWACCIAVRLLIDELDKKKLRDAWTDNSEVDAASADPSPEAAYVGVEMAAIVEKALGQLPAAQRDPFADSLRGKSNEELAREYNTTRNGIKIRISRARTAVRRLIGLRGNEEESR